MKFKLPFLGREAVNESSPVSKTSELIRLSRAAFLVIGVGVLSISTAFAQEAEEPEGPHLELTYDKDGYPYPLLPLLEPKAENMRVGTDPFTEVHNAQPSLWFCDQVGAYVDRRGFPEPVPSVVFQAGNILEGHLKSLVKAEKDRLKNLSMIEDTREKFKIFANDRSSTSSVAREGAKKYRKIVNAYKIIERSSEANKARWEALHKKMTGNDGIIFRLKAFVNWEAAMGRSRKRCAQPIPPLSPSEVGWYIPSASEVPSPRFHEYDYLPATYRPAPYQCYDPYPEDGSAKPGTGSSIIEKVNYFQRKIEEHLQVALQRDSVYPNALMGAKNAPDQPAKARRLRFIGEGGKSGVVGGNDRFIVLWKTLLDDVIELKKGIIKASNAQSSTAMRMRRCKPE